MVLGEVSEAVVHLVKVSFLVAHADKLLSDGDFVRYLASPLEGRNDWAAAEHERAFEIAARLDRANELKAITKGLTLKPMPQLVEVEKVVESFKNTTLYERYPQACKTWIKRVRVLANGGEGKEI